MYLLNKDMPKHTSTLYDLIYGLFKCMGTVLGASLCISTFVSYYCLIFLQLWATWIFKWTLLFLMIFSLSVLFVGALSSRVLEFSVSVWIHPELECKQFIWEIIPGDRGMKKGDSQGRNPVLLGIFTIRVEHTSELSSQRGKEAEIFVPIQLAHAQGGACLHG